MKKLLSLLIVVLVLTLAITLASCGLNTNKNTTTTTTTTTTNTGTQPNDPPEDKCYSQGLALSYSVVGRGTCKDLDIIIPDTYKGLPVTSIGDNAFQYCDSLTSVVIPDSVTSIGDYAFYICSKLTIYCEAESKPAGWQHSWNSSNRPVVWGYTGK